MAKIAIMMADGCEEIEALAVVDLLRRAGIVIDMISVTDRAEITGSHGVRFYADKTVGEFDGAGYDGIVLPGGKKGTENLAASEAVLGAVKEFYSAGKLVSAICAAPSVLGKCGILKGKRAISYPSFEETIASDGAVLTYEPAVRDGNVITSRGMGTAIDFGLAIIAYLTDDETAAGIAKQIVYKA